MKCVKCGENSLKKFFFLINARLYLVTLEAFLSSVSSGNFSESFLNMACDVSDEHKLQNKDKKKSMAKTQSTTRKCSPKVPI